MLLFVEILSGGRRGPGVGYCPTATGLLSKLIVLIGVTCPLVTENTFHSVPAVFGTLYTYGSALPATYSLTWAPDVDIVAEVLLLRSEKLWT